MLEFFSLIGSFFVSIVDALFHILITTPPIVLFFIVALTCALENVPILGFVIPGQFLLLFAGIAAHDNLANIYLIGFFGALGGFIGDMVSYEMAKKYGKRVVTDYGKYFSIKEEHITLSQAFFEKYGGYALILGRFNPITRWFTPIVAGISHMKTTTFYAYNVVSAFIWSFSYIAIGYLFRESYLIALKYVKNSALVLLLLIAVGYVLYRTFVIKKVALKIERAVEDEHNQKRRQ